MASFVFSLSVQAPNLPYLKAVPMSLYWLLRAVAERGREFWPQPGSRRHAQPTRCLCFQGINEMRGGGGGYSSGARKADVPRIGRKGIRFCFFVGPFVD